MAYWATLSQIETAIGGAERARQLAKADAYGDAVYLDFIAKCQAPANAYLRSLLRKVIDPDNAAVASDPLIADHEATLTARNMHRKGAGGLEMPPELKTAIEDFNAWEQKLSDGKIAFDSPDATATEAGVKMVQTDTDGRRVTRSNMRGFC